MDPLCRTVVLIFCRTLLISLVDSKASITISPRAGAVALVGRETTVRLLVRDAIHSRYRDATISARIHDDKLAIILNNGGGIEYSANDTGQEIYRFRLAGLQTGLSRMDIFAHTDYFPYNETLVTGYDVAVVEPVDAFSDVFAYVLMTSQMLTFVMLGLRLRLATMREVLLHPCALISAVICQVILVPLMCVALSVCLSPKNVSVLGLLLVASCPPGMLVPIAAVLLQAHVELAVLLTIILSVTAFGVMPFWLVMFDILLGVQSERVEGPYVFLAISLGVVVVPLAVGALLQRRKSSVADRFDQVLPPVSILLLLMELVVHAVDSRLAWDLLTWRELASVVLLPVGGAVIATITTATFHRKLTQVKTAAIVVALHSCALAKMFNQMTHSLPEASAISLTLQAIDLFMTCLVLFLYMPHLILWILWKRYKSAHNHGGLGSIAGEQVPFGEMVVRGMIKAGEITFGRFYNAHRPELDSSPQLGAFRAAFDYPAAKKSLAVNTLGGLNGRKVIHASSSEESIYKSYKMNKTSSSSFFLHYLAVPENQARGECESSSGSSTRSNLDSLDSIDYDMLTDSNRHSGENGAAPSSDSDSIYTKPLPPGLSPAKQPPPVTRASTLALKRSCTGSESRSSSDTKNSSFGFSWIPQALVNAYLFGRSRTTSLNKGSDKQADVSGDRCPSVSGESSSAPSISRSPSACPSSSAFDESVSRKDLSDKSTCSGGRLSGDDSDWAADLLQSNLEANRSLGESRETLATVALHDEYDTNTSITEMVSQSYDTLETRINLGSTL